MGHIVKHALAVSVSSVSDRFCMLSYIPRL
nr:MAG TPA: hypothetical protein [Caudoviricetes sp.]